MPADNDRVTKLASKTSAPTIPAQRTATRSPAATLPAAKKAVAKKAVAKKAVAKKAAVRTKAVRPLGAVVAVRQPVTPKSAKKTPAKKVTARKPAVRKAAPARATVAASTAVPAASSQARPQVRIKSRRPLIALVRRSDSRPVSYGERLAELMHKKLDHAGPVCHRCRTNASHLAGVRAAGAVVAV